MTAEEIIYSRMTGRTEVTDIVDDRIYPLELKQAALLPALAYYRVSTLPNNTLDGDTGVAYVVMRVEVHGTDYEVARNLVKEIRTSMKATSTFRNQRDESDPERGIIRLFIDFTIREDIDL